MEKYETWGDKEFLQCQPSNYFFPKFERAELPRSARNNGEGAASVFRD